MKRFAYAATAAVLLAGGAIVGVAGPASAHTPVVNVDCDSISLDLFNYPDGANTFTAVLDGVDMGTNVVFGTEYHSGNIDLDPSVAHTWTIDIDAVDGDTWDVTIEGSSDEDCLPDVPEVPEQPADLVTYGEWVSGTADCDATEVIQTRTKSVTTYTLVDNTWVAGEPVVTNEEQTVAIEPTACEPEQPTYQPTCTTITDTYVIEGDGVISVPGEWESSTIAVPFSGTLADIGTALFINATPLQYVGLHIHTAEGTIVFEEEASYNGQLWSNSAWDGVNAGLGYAALGTIEDYIHLNGDVVVTGIDLLYTSPEASSTTVENFGIGCTNYSFEPAVIEEPPVVTPPVVTPPTVVTPPVTEVVPAAVITTDTLASTGVSQFQFWMILVGGLMLLGLLILAVDWFRKRTDKAAAEQE